MVEYLLHERHLLDDMPARVRLYRRRQHVQQLHVAVVAVGVVLHHLHRLQLLQACFLGYLVLPLVGIVLQVPHIGDVTHIAHLVAEVLQVPIQQVESDGRAGMPQVRIPIHRRSAHIHPHMPLMQRTKILFLTS